MSIFCNRELDPPMLLKIEWQVNVVNIFVFGYVAGL
jgi:hypothetical protein